MRNILIALASLSLMAGFALAQDNLLEEVQQRGELACGVNDQLPGFGSVDAQGNFQGFDVDYCRAIAAAVLGDADAVEYRALTAQERFTAIQTGEIDVLIRNTTWTSSRDTDVGLNFAPTTFYDGQGFMVKRDAGIESIQDLEGASICVQSGTTTELNLADVLAALDIEYEPVILETADQAIAAYDAGQCEAYTTDVSGLVSRRPTLQNPEGSVIFEERISKEPLGPSVLHGDDVWFDAVKWITFGTFAAEEYGITSENVREVAESTRNPAVRRFLGVEGQSLEQLGLDQDAMINMIEQVGNYEEIYNRNLGPETQFDIPRGLNSLYTEGGLLYSPPFR